MSSDLSEVAYQNVEDLKQIVEDFLLPIYKERIRKYIKIKGEMKENVCYEGFVLERPDWRQKHGKINSFSRWLWFQAFNSLRREGELVAHHHGRGHRITYTLKE